MIIELKNRHPLTYQASHTFKNRFGQKIEIIVMRSDRNVALHDLTIEFNKKLA